MTTRFFYALALSLSALSVGARALAADTDARLADQPAGQLSDEIRDKIAASGAPMKSLDRILKFLKENSGDQVSTEIYTCKGQPETSTKPCDESIRERTTRKLTIAAHRYVGIVDFTKPSTEERFFVIDMQTGDVQKYLTTHGRGSGQGRYAYKFSNLKDSNQSSLGLFFAGETYVGGKGETLRLYGLETSNDQAYNRDVVIHSADYATTAFIKRINPKTKAPFNRLGLSWGCPALAPDVKKKVLPLLKGGALIDLYQPDLMEAALSGKEVATQPPAE